MDNPICYLRRTDDSGGVELATLTREQALEAALWECRTDLMIASHNALDAAKTDPRWEGVFEKLDARVKQADAALAMTPAQGVDVAEIANLIGSVRLLTDTGAHVMDGEGLTFSHNVVTKILGDLDEALFLLRALTPPAPAPWTPPSQTGVWPDFIAPSRYENPHPDWTDPALPDFRLIWKVARECGYAVGLHGSMKRDCDLIAAPWADDAVASLKLIERLCSALGGKTVGPIAGKPHGRLGFILQSERWEKNIDISVMPLTPPAPEARDD